VRCMAVQSVHSVAPIQCYRLKRLWRSAYADGLRKTAYGYAEGTRSPSRWRVVSSCYGMWSQRTWLQITPISAERNSTTIWEETARF